MKKLTKRGLIRKLDKAFGEIVRSRGVCAKCGKGAEQVTLHCAHIFSRQNLSVRWNLDNAMALCYYDHFWWAHKEPILFTEFVKEYLGAYKYEQLKIRARSIKKWSIDDLSALLKTLTKD